MTELCNIAKKYGTDKVSHNYTYYYHEYLEKYMNEDTTMLEIGIFKGSSIKMWDEYLKKGLIYCIDNCTPNSGGDLLCLQNTIDYLNEYSSKIHADICCQKDKKKLNELYHDISFDFIVDDGGHFMEDQQISLGALFKNVKSKGYYIIEDIVSMWGLQTGSWWGQRDGVFDTNATREGGTGNWMNKFMQTKTLKSEKNFSDSTWYVLQEYLKNKKINSIYLSEEENKYLNDNIENIALIAAPQKREDHIHNLLGVPTYQGTEGTKLKNGCIAIIQKK